MTPYNKSDTANTLVKGTYVKAITFCYTETYLRSESA
jgi:hypothetical protein